jgi:hypothetical protein
MVNVRHAHLDGLTAEAAHRSSIWRRPGTASGHLGADEWDLDTFFH